MTQQEDKNSPPAIPAGGEESMIYIDGQEVFTIAWVKMQMQALQDLYYRLRFSISICKWATAVSLLLSLAAIAMR